MTTPSQKAQQTLEVLQQVAEVTLERKRRLGHYAVIWRDGRPMEIGEDAPTPPVDYTEERHTWLKSISLDDVLTQMRQRQDDDKDTDQYDEIIE